MKEKRINTFIAVIIIVVVLAAVFAAYWVWWHKPSMKAPAITDFGIPVEEAIERAKRGEKLPLGERGFLGKKAWTPAPSKSKEGIGKR